MASTATLRLRLAGPMQSWGTTSRFTRRTTNAEPSKSGVLGLLAAAQGRRRTDPIEDLLDLRFGVRVDQPGQLLRDFQTESRPVKKAGRVERVSMPLSYRYYLADAVFLAVIEGDRTLVESLDTAVRRPAFPLSLGRRSCPPAGRMSLGVSGDDFITALRDTEWLASQWYQKRHPDEHSLWVVRDVLDGETSRDRERDVPLSFNPAHRAYGLRSVIRELVPLPGREPRARIAEPDPFDALEV